MIKIKLTQEEIDEIKDWFYNQVKSTRYVKEGLEDTSCILSEEILHDIVNSKYTKFVKYCNKSKEYKVIKKYQDLNLSIKEIMEEAYNRFAQKRDNKETVRTTLRKKLKVDYCTYCEQTQITSGTHELDHYLPKSEFPILALNFYNLIPSCKACNQTFKGSKTKPILNPFFESYDNNGVFDFPIYKLERDELSILNKSENLKIREKVNNSINDVLNIQKRYNEEPDIIKDIVTLRSIYNNYTKSYSNCNGIIPASEAPIIKSDLVRHLISKKRYNKCKNDIIANWEKLINETKQ